MSRLALGTVQFGAEYGITNILGRVPESEVREILQAAVQAGMEVLDTAAAYGDAEEVLGRNLDATSGFRLVSKTIPLRRSIVDDESVQKVAQGLAQSLSKLRRARLDGLLVHHAQDLLVPGGEKLFQLLRDQQKQGIIGRVGVSIYDASQLESIIDRYPIEIVQLPLNVLDQRLAKSGWLQSLKKMGIEIHVRSAFLQGILLADVQSVPDRLDAIKTGVARFHQACRRGGVSPIAACLGYLQQLPEVDHVVCGVLSKTQLEEIAEAWTSGSPLAAADYDSLALPDHPYLNPANWPAARP